MRPQLCRPAPKSCLSFGSGTVDCGLLSFGSGIVDCGVRAGLGMGFLSGGSLGRMVELGNHIPNGFPIGNTNHVSTNHIQWAKWRVIYRT